MTDPNAEIDVNVDLDIQEILLVASQHDIAKLRSLIRTHEQVANPANVKDPETGFTPLHAAIAACEPEEEEEKQTNGTEGKNQEEQGKVAQSGLKTVRFLL